MKAESFCWISVGRSGASPHQINDPPYRPRTDFEDENENEAIVRYQQVYPPSTTKLLPVK